MQSKEENPQWVPPDWHYVELARKNGMRVVQLTNPDTPGNGGFSPRPTPELIATYKMPHGGHSLAISKGVDRDRATCGHRAPGYDFGGARRSRRSPD